MRMAAQRMEDRVAAHDSNRVSSQPFATSILSPPDRRSLQLPPDPHSLPPSTVLQTSSQCAPSATSALPRASLLPSCRRAATSLQHPPVPLSLSLPVTPPQTLHLSSSSPLLSSSLLFLRNPSFVSSLTLLTDATHSNPTALLNTSLHPYVFAFMISFTSLLLQVPIATLFALPF